MPKPPKAAPAAAVIQDKIPIRCRFTEMVDTSKVRPHPDNPNHHPAEQLDLLEKIIRATGFRKPLVISNQTGLLIKGHGVYECARKRLKMKKVPVEFQDYASPEEEKADMVADNSLAQMSDMPTGDLVELVTQVQKDAPDFDLALFALPEPVLAALEDASFLPNVKLPKARKGAAAGDDVEEDAEHAPFKVVYPAAVHARFLGAVQKYRKEHKLKSLGDALLHRFGLKPLASKKKGAAHARAKN